MGPKKEEYYSYEESYIYMYCYVYGFSGLYLHNYREVGKFIGRTEGSIRMQLSNLDYLIKGKGGYYSFSHMHVDVYKELKEAGRYKSFLKMKQFIKQDEHEREQLLKAKGVTKFRPLN